MIIRLDSFSKQILNISVFFDLYQSLNDCHVRICKYTIFFSVSFCQTYRVTDEALIAETPVWPGFFRLNVFFALKGSKLSLLLGGMSQILPYTTTIPRISGSRSTLFFDFYRHGYYSVT